MDLDPQSNTVGRPCFCVAEIYSLGPQPLHQGSIDVISLLFETISWCVEVFQVGNLNQFWRWRLVKWFGIEYSFMVLN